MSADGGIDAKASESIAWDFIRVPASSQLSLSRLSHRLMLSILLKRLPRHSAPSRSRAFLPIQTVSLAVRPVLPCWTVLAQ